MRLERRGHGAERRAMSEVTIVILSPKGEESGV